MNFKSKNDKKDMKRNKETNRFVYIFLKPNVQCTFREKKPERRRNTEATTTTTKNTPKWNSKRNENDRNNSQSSNYKTYRL